ncbi:MAG: DUF2877 domain-containing protein [Conexivisphaerales archaeon]|nr:DUF2877 domain-containing protein [Conexivisphaerales archaeon]
MTKKLKSEPLAILKSSCIRPLSAELVYENEEVIDYVSDEGALFLISDEVDPEPSSIVVKNFPELKKLEHGRIVYYAGKLKIGSYHLDLSHAKIFSTADLYLKKYNEIFYDELSRFISENYSCELYAPSVKKVCRTLLEFKPENLYDSYYLESLIGFGIGMTPSGDDFLVGLMASLKGSYFFERVKEAINKALIKTNSISREFLRCAVLGEFSASFAELIQAANDEIDAEKYFLKISLKGHTSGKESLLGFLKGLEIRKRSFIRP